jgi:hypothetical protein
MTNASNSTTLPAWPFWPFDLSRLTNSAPSVDITQPINPGWTFGNLISVTEQNSSAPDTERDIVAAESYGRQLGRVIDALVVLITDVPKSKPEEPAFAKLIELHEKIESIKVRAASRRLDRFVADLTALRTANSTEYQRVKTELQQTLSATG